MQPSSVRDYVLKDHGVLRVRLERVQAEAGAVERGAQERVEPLLAEADALLRELSTHMEWEDVHLAAALRDEAVWGPEREKRLKREHREQREGLLDMIEALRRPDRAGIPLAQKLADFVAMVGAEMEEEEFCLLDPDVLRDDVVGIGVETG